MLRVSAKVDYAIRALVALARVAPRPIKGDRLAQDHAIPFRFLEVTLGELRQSGLIASRRGSGGGYWLARAPEEISLEDVIVAIQGPLVDRRIATIGTEPVDGTDQITRELWDTAEADLQSLFANVTLADLVAGILPDRADRPLPARRPRPEPPAIAGVTGRRDQTR